MSSKNSTPDNPKYTKYLHAYVFMYTSNKQLVMDDRTKSFALWLRVTTQMNPLESLSLYVCFSPKQQPSSGSLDSTHSICTLYGVNNMCIAVCTSLSQLLYIVLFIYIINRKIYMHLPRNLHREIHFLITHNIVFDCQTAFDFEASTI